MCAPFTATSVEPHWLATARDFVADTMLDALDTHGTFVAWNTYDGTTEPSSATPTDIIRFVADFAPDDAWVEDDTLVIVKNGGRTRLTLWAEIVYPDETGF